MCIILLWRTNITVKEGNGLKHQDGTPFVSPKKLNVGGTNPPDSTSNPVPDSTPAPAPETQINNYTQYQQLTDRAQLARPGNPSGSG